jgi:hypothetical protein
MITRSELGGAAGRILGVVPGGTEPIQETTFIKGNRIRKDDGSESSSIMDWESGILTLLNHQDRSYVQLNLEEMAQAAEEVVQSMEEEGESSPLKDAVVDGSREGAEEVKDARDDPPGQVCFGKRFHVGTSGRVSVRERSKGCTLQALWDARSMIIKPSQRPPPWL